MTDLLLPKLGLTMTEATILEWLKQPGETVVKGDVLFTFETEKSTLEFESPAAGVLTEIRVQPGETVACYTVVGIVGDSSQRPPLHEVERRQESGVNLPTGRTFRASPRAKRAARELGIDLTRLVGSGPQSRIVEADVLAAQSEVIPATPVAKRVAATANIDLNTISGTGRNGKITRSDIEKITNPMQDVSPISPSPNSERGLEDEVEAGEVIPLTSIRAVTARRMTQSAQTAPQVTLTTEADATELVNARRQVNVLLSDEKISYNTLLMAICARALAEHPALNAIFEETAIRVQPSINIGLAIDTEKGLLVPVVQHVDQLDLLAIQRTLAERIGRAQAGHSQPADLEGGTFTISNLGMFDIDAFTPLINLPQAAILGVGRIEQKVVPRDGQIVIRERMALSLSFDHRVADGGPAARFLKDIKDLIENPYGLLIGKG